MLLGAETYAAIMRNRPGEATLLTLVLGDPRYLVERTESASTVRAVEGLLAQVARVVEEAQAEGVFVEGDPMTRGVLLWTAAHGAAQLRKFDRFGAAALEVSKVNHAFALDLLSAWGAERSSIAAAREIASTIANQMVPARSPEKE